MNILDAAKDWIKYIEAKFTGMDSAKVWAWIRLFLCFFLPFFLGNTRHRFYFSSDIFVFTWFLFFLCSIEKFACQELCKAWAERGKGQPKTNEEKRLRFSLP